MKGVGCRCEGEAQLCTNSSSSCAVHNAIAHMIIVLEWQSCVVYSTGIHTTLCHSNIVVIAGCNVQLGVKLGNKSVRYGMRCKSLDVRCEVQHEV